MYDKPVVAWCPVDWVHYATPCLSHWVLSYAPLCRESLLVSPWLLGVRWLVPLCYTSLIPLGAARVSRLLLVSPWLLGVRWLVPLCYTSFFPLGAARAALAITTKRKVGIKSICCIMDSNQPCCIGPASSTLCVPESFLIVRVVRCFPRFRHNVVVQCRLNGMSLTPLNPKQIAGGDYARTGHHRLHLTSAWTIRTRVRVVQYLNVAASGLLLSPHRRQPHMHHALLRRQIRTSHLHLVELMHRWYDMFVVVRWQRR